MLFDGNVLLSADQNQWSDDRGLDPEDPDTNSFEKIYYALLDSVTSVLNCWFI